MATQFDDGTMDNSLRPRGYPQPTYAPAGVPTMGNTGGRTLRVPEPLPTTGQPIAPADANMIAQTLGGGTPAVDTSGTPAPAPNLNSIVQGIFGGNGFSGSRPAAPTAGAGRGFVNPPLVTPAALNAAPAVPDPTPTFGSIDGVSSEDRTAQSLRSAAHSRSMADRSIEEAQKGTFGPTPGLGIIDGAGAAAAERQAFFDAANLRNAAAQGSWSPRLGYRGNDDAVKAAMVPLQNRQRLNEISLKNAGEQAIAERQDNTIRRGQDGALAINAANRATTERGQDITLRGQDMTARTAALQGARDQMNKDRQFGLDTQKFGAEQAKTNYEQRQAAVKNLTDQLGTQFRTTDANGKDVADTAKVGDFMTRAQATLGYIAQQHRAAGRGELADQIESKGLAAMSPQERQQLLQAYALRERAQQAKGGGVNQGTFVDSDNLLDFLQAPGGGGVERRTFGGDRVNLRGGSSLSVNDLKYNEPANALFPDWGKQRDLTLTNGLRLN